MPAHRKYDCDLEKDLSEERLTAATQTLLAASACYLARPKDHQIPSDAERAKWLAEIVREVESLAKDQRDVPADANAKSAKFFAKILADTQEFAAKQHATRKRFDANQVAHIAQITKQIEEFARKQTVLAEVALTVELSADIHEAYTRWAGKPRKKAPRAIAPGIKGDHMTDWKAWGPAFTRQRIAQAWQAYTLRRYGAVSQRDDRDLDHLISKEFVVDEASDPGQGPADHAQRAVAFLLGRGGKISGRKTDVTSREFHGRSVGIAAEKRRWPVESPQFLEDGKPSLALPTWGQPEGGDRGFFFGAQVAPLVEDAIDDFARRSCGLFFRGLGHALEGGENARALLVLLLGRYVEQVPAFPHQTVRHFPGIGLDGKVHFWSGKVLTAHAPRLRVMPAVQRVWSAALGGAFSKSK